MYVTLEEAKSQCKVDYCYHGADKQLYHLIETAECYVANYLKFDSLEELFPDGVLPLPVKHAVLLLVDHWYENASATSAAQLRKIEIGVERLLDFYDHKNPNKGK